MGGRALWVGVPILLAAAGAAGWIGTVRNEDGARVIAHAAGGKMPSELEAAVLHLIEAGVIHGSVRGGKPLNVRGRRFVVEQNDGAVTWRSPGLWRVGTAEVTVRAARREPAQRDAPDGRGP